MKYFHYVEISFFVKESEPFELVEGLTLQDSIKDKIKKFGGEHCEKKDIILDKIDPIGDFKNSMYRVSVLIEKAADRFMKDIVEYLSPEERKLALETIDEDCCLFIRFDKNDFFSKEEKIVVTHGNCIHLRAKVAAYPAKQENAIKVFRGLIE